MPYRGRYHMGWTCTCCWGPKTEVSAGAQWKKKVREDAVFNRDSKCTDLQHRMRPLAMDNLGTLVTSRRAGRDGGTVPSVHPRRGI